MAYIFSSIPWCWNRKYLQFNSVYLFCIHEAVTVYPALIFCMHSWGILFTVKYKLKLGLSRKYCVSGDVSSSPHLSGLNHPSSDHFNKHKQFPKTWNTFVCSPLPHCTFLLICAHKRFITEADISKNAAYATLYVRRQEEPSSGQTWLEILHLYIEAFSWC